MARRPPEVNRDDAILFSESNSRFLIEVTPEHRGAFENRLQGLPFALVGRCVETPELRVRGLAGEVLFTESVAALQQSWQAPLSFGGAP